MKKYFCFLSLFFIVASCTEDVKFNNPAFQGLKENVFWRAQSYKAHLGENGSIVVEGSLGYEKVILQMTSTSEQTFALGNDELSKASYENKLSTELSAFSTGTDKGSGQICSAARWRCWASAAGRSASSSTRWATCCSS